MSGTAVVAHGVGGIKACIHGLAIEHVLRENDVMVPFRTGASGGAIAAAAASFTATEARGIPWLVERISRIDEKSLYDEDASQQIIDRIRKIPVFKRIFGTRKGDRPMLGLYRGNALHRALRDLFDDLGTVRSTFEVVSCSLDPEIYPPAIPLAAANGVGQKRIRRFAPHASNTTDGLTLVADAVRASAAIPFVFRPHVIDGAHEVDGGALTLTTEEVAADWVHDQHCRLPASDVGDDAVAHNDRVVLVVNDMHVLPDVQDGVADDVVELGVMLVRAVGAHIQEMNRYYMSRRISGPGIGVCRLTPPNTTTTARQFETGKAVSLFNEYVHHLRADDRLIQSLAWLRG